MISETRETREAAVWGPPDPRFPDPGLSVVDALHAIEEQARTAQPERIPELGPRFIPREDNELPAPLPQRDPGATLRTPPPAPAENLPMFEAVEADRIHRAQVSATDPAVLGQVLQALNEWQPYGGLIRGLLTELAGAAAERYTPLRDLCTSCTAEAACDWHAGQEAKAAWFTLLHESLDRAETDEAALAVIRDASAEASLFCAVEDGARA